MIFKNKSAQLGPSAPSEAKEASQAKLVWWIRWVVYIFSSIRVVLPRIRLDFLPVELTSVSFCPFQIFSTIASVRAEQGE